MIPDEVPSLAEIKCDVNEFLWRVLPPWTTLAEAEVIAVRMADEIRQEWLRERAATPDGDSKPMPLSGVSRSSVNSCSPRCMNCFGTGVTEATIPCPRCSATHEVMT